MGINNFVGPAISGDLSSLPGPLTSAGGKSINGNAVNMFAVNSGNIKSELSGFGVDSFFFNFPSLSASDSFKLFNYQFVIYNSANNDKPILTLTMPLGPESISYSVPGAVSTTVTMKGISEEHNGAPLRPISITGTSGIRPSSGFSGGIGAGGSGLLDYAFANTIAAFGKLENSIKKISTAFSNDTNIQSPIAANKESDYTLDQTGYTIIHNMMRFFDWYLDAKKKGNKGLRLCFCMNKDRMFFDVTLNGYSIRKSRGSLEYEYSINMTAWRRRENSPIGEVKEIVKNTGANPSDINPFAKLSLALQEGTKAITEVGGLMTGLQNDFEANILGPIKQVGLLIGAVNGYGNKMSNFGSGISNSLKEAVKKFLQNQGFKNKDQKNEKLDKILKKFGVGGGGVGPGIKPDGPVANSNKKLKKTDAAPPDSADPFGTVFNNPNSFVAFFDEIPLDQLEIPQAVQNLIDAEIAKAKALTSDDVKKIKDNVDAFAAKLSESLGAGDATANRLLGRPAPTKIRQLSVNDIVLLNHFNNISGIMDQVIFSLQENEKQSDNDYYSFYGNYARTQGIDFAENSSKFYIPFPAEASLESLAVQYLGNIDRWIEIAAINNLKSPYVDEEGYMIPFKSSGSGNSMLVANSDGLYIGQIVILQSNTQVPEKRKIKSIDIISTIESLIYFDGPADLSRFILVDNPQIKAFLPQTVNSNMIIAMPSDVAVNIPGSIRVNPDSSDLSAIALIAKSDFQLIFSPTGFADLSFIGNDIQTSEGMANLVQAGTIKLLTKEGDLLHDPTFGNPVKIGDSVAEFDANDILSKLSKLFADDPRFVGIIANKISLRGGAVTIDLLAGVTGSKAYLPLSVDVPR